jgi:nicotinamide-nucleotide amidase
MGGCHMDTLITDIYAQLRARHWMIATVESCTGGLIGWLLTQEPGASEFVDRGFITYSNEAKTEMLGVPASLIAAHGAVSEPVARAMAEGAINASRANIAVSVTGIAGPGGGTTEKPVGLVYIAISVRGGETRAYEHHFSGDRNAIRKHTAIAALMHMTQNLLEIPLPA